jgi:hypothetical protein
MKYSIIIIFFYIIYSTAYSQFPAKLDVNSSGEIVSSPTTTTGQKYRITVTGTYSMWPLFSDCHGVDAAYVYDVPQEEIDTYKWPPKEIFGFPFVEIPHWVGDNKLWSFPPKEFGTPLFALSFRKYKGFRIDEEPLPNSGINMITHRYQTEKMGTGLPFQFQILDSNYDIKQAMVIPRFEDNCGALNVLVEAIADTDINICDIKPICDQGNYSGIKLNASIFIKDTTIPSGKRNLLYNIDPDQLSILENGIKKNVDSISCGERSIPISVGLLIDRSGSMEQPISEQDQTIRIDASKRAINKFIDNLSNKDSAFVMSFSDDISTDKDWTNNKQDLKNAINSILPDSKTAFYGAIQTALSKVVLSSNPHRALVVLSDGCNNVSPSWSDSLQSFIQKTNIPVYIIALGLGNDPCDIDGRSKMELICNASRGRVYDVYNSSKLDSVYLQLSRDIAQDECCSIFFHLEPCTPKSEINIELIFSPNDSTTISKSISFICDTCPAAVNVDDQLIQDPYDKAFLISPNPSDGYLSIKYKSEFIGDITFSISNSLGVVVDVWSSHHYQNGYAIIEKDISNLTNGIYFITMTKNGLTFTQKISLIK